MTAVIWTCLVFTRFPSLEGQEKRCGSSDVRQIDGLEEFYGRRAKSGKMDRNGSLKAASSDGPPEW